MTMKLCFIFFVRVRQWKELQTGKKNSGKQRRVLNLTTQNWSLFSVSRQQFLSFLPIFPPKWRVYLFSHLERGDKKRTDLSQMTSSSEKGNKGKTWLPPDFLSSQKLYCPQRTFLSRVSSHHHHRQEECKCFLSKNFAEFIFLSLETWELDGSLFLETQFPFSSICLSPLLSFKCNFGLTFSLLRCLSHSVPPLLLLSNFWFLSEVLDKKKRDKNREAETTTNSPLHRCLLDSKEGSGDERESLLCKKRKGKSF